MRSCGREAEGGGLLNRYTALKPYRGFESLRLRQYPLLETLYTDVRHRSRMCENRVRPARVSTVHTKLEQSRGKFVGRKYGEKITARQIMSSPTAQGASSVSLAGRTQSGRTGIQSSEEIRSGLRPRRQRSGMQRRNIAVHKAGWNRRLVAQRKRALSEPTALMSRLRWIRSPYHLGYLRLWLST
jgi:hypothetical protein